MTELRDRVVARLVTAQNSRDPAPLRGSEAADDALALLREAAPAPEGTIDLESVAAVFWTFWFRHGGDADPEAQRNLTVVFGTFGFLCPRLPPQAGLPDVLRQGFDPADPSHEARFAHLISSAYGEEVTGEGGAVALDRSLAWAETALEYLRDDDHAGFAELAVQALELHVLRFQREAEPGSLAAAARYGRAVCERLPLLDPELARAAASVALRTVVDAARLLGDPELAVVDRLLAMAPDGSLTQENSDGLATLRLLVAQPVTWPGERDLRIGAAIAEAGVADQDPSRIACAVRRLRTALSATPADHPAHARTRITLAQALAALARARDDRDAAREAAQLMQPAGAPAGNGVTVPGARRAAPTAGHPADPGTGTAVAQALAALARAGEDGGAALEAVELLDSAGLLGDEQRAVLDACREFESDGSPAALGRFVEQVRLHTTRTGRPPDIDVEILDLASGFVPDDTADERIARYRAALPAHGPHRHAHIAVLAALTGMRAGALRPTAPARADLLAAESRELTEEVAAQAPPGFPATDLLRRGAYEAALPLAVVSVSGESLPDELVALTSQLSRLQDIRLDAPENLDSDIAVIREMFADVDEDDTSLRPYLAAALGSALSARSAGRGDPATLDEVVELLRYARAHAPDLAGHLDKPLADALTALSVGRFDPENAREASALLASATSPSPTQEPQPPYGEMALTETDHAVLAARTEFHTALQNYLLGHEPAQLERARRTAVRMRELTRGPWTGSRPWYDLMGDAYADLVETVGPGGGPRGDLGDDIVEQCRRTFAACPAGHPMRPMAGTTLARALVQRALLLRPADPGRAAALVAEADELGHALGEETPRGAPDIGGTIRMFVDLMARGRLPDGTAAQEPGRSPADLFDTVLGPLRDRLAGAADPRVWRDRAVPVGMRAHGELGAAAGALGGPRPRVDLALDHLEAGVEAMAGLTDRGSDQRSAEHGLSTFEGDIRTIVELILTHLVGRDLAARLPGEAAGLKAVMERAAAGDDPDAVREALAALRLPSAHGRTASGPDVDRAAELLDRGRGLLLARRIESRADIDALRTAHPDLAAEYERLTNTLADAPAESGRRPGTEILAGRADFEPPGTPAAGPEGAEVPAGRAGSERPPGPLAAGPESADTPAGRAGSERSPGPLAAGPESADIPAGRAGFERSPGTPAAGPESADTPAGRVRSERPPGALAAGPESADAPAGRAEWARLAGLRASRELDALIARIRTEPGFEDFLRPLTAPQLRDLAADGPVVVLNQGRRHCHALVVTARSITALHLDVGADEVTGAARRLRDAVDAINAQGTARPSPRQLVAAGTAVRETLAWTWHKVVRPVLDLAGCAGPVPRHGTWPRVWWVPTGAFSALPLHAAQCTAPDCALDGCGTALDAVVSSYVPGLRTLAHTRSRARRRPGHGGALLVAEPEQELPGVAAATAYAAGLLGAPAPLIGAAATREAVLGALHQASWAHFGCHAATDPTEPSGALLRLPSGEPVSVLEICRARPSAARLAFLAACGTARTAERLTDEAIHITSSFLLAGFPAAVGTLWAVDSTHADHMTRAFYRRTTAPDAPGAAHALHEAVRGLRRRIPDRPHVWAAYVHAGT
ncbi:CHAT domain-containing protein [Streptomyces sp. NPDC057806]|uniref:CHAT domain-containing protein n=1 Tax=Streptomyces sp. NPDC057806 TaxID=3346255 RepID=UPI0036B0E43E